MIFVVIFINMWRLCVLERESDSSGMFRNTIAIVSSCRWHTCSSTRCWFGNEWCWWMLHLTCAQGIGFTHFITSKFGSGSTSDQQKWPLNVCVAIVCSGAIGDIVTCHKWFSSHTQAPNSLTSSETHPHSWSWHQTDIGHLHTQCVHIFASTFVDVQTCEQWLDLVALYQF